MKAVVTHEGTLSRADFPAPVPQDGQVLVRTLCCGICGSDLHALHNMDQLVAMGRKAGGSLAMELDPRRPVVLGHEFCAEILEHGPGTNKSMKVGTRVVSMPIVFDAGGPSTVGYSNDYPGGFGEFMVLNESLLLEVPNGLPATHAALTEPFAVGAHAVANSSIAEPSVALVIGCGPIGLSVIASLKARGYGPVLAADFSPTRRSLAERFGADVVIDPAKETPHARWSDFGIGANGFAEMLSGTTPSKRAIIFECVGVPGMLQRVIHECPIGSQIIVAGVCMEPDTFEPYMAINKQIEIRFVLAYTPDEFRSVLDDIAEGRIDVSHAITDVVGFDGLSLAFDRLSSPGDQVKILFDPQLEA